MGNNTDELGWEAYMHKACNKFDVRFFRSCSDPNQSEPIWTNLNLPKPIQTNLSQSKQIQNDPNQFESIWANLNQSEQI